MIHTPVERILEVIFYTFLNSLPYHALVLYGFRKHLRNSWPVTLLCLLIPTLFEAVLYFGVAFSWFESTSLINILWSVGYLLTYCLVIKEQPGKVCFIILVLLNVANFNTVASKYLEYLLFPHNAMERFHLSSSLALIIVQLVTVTPHFFILEKTYIPAIARKSDMFLWRYLWIVPFLFYFLWHYHIHFDAASSLEVATDIHSNIFLLLINCGAYIIYYIVLRYATESANNAMLRSHNHQLAMQTLQYENLQERIAETRKANHDLRHHVATMSNLLEAEAYSELKQYFQQMLKLIPSSSSMMYCQHNTVNMLLVYFGQMAESNGVRYEVDMRLPASLPIPDSDLTVLLGNLVENAVEASSVQTIGEKKVIIRGLIEAGRLMFTIDNTFDRPTKKDSSGVFISSKHPGNGIGVESSRSIVTSYHGTMDIHQENHMFCVSIMINL